MFLPPHFLQFPAAESRGTPVDGAAPGVAGFRLPKSLGGEGHEIVLGSYLMEGILEDHTRVKCSTK